MPVTCLVAQVYELSEAAEEFLKAQFAAHDQDGDFLLTWQELDAMFSTAPPPVWQVSPGGSSMFPTAPSLVRQVVLVGAPCSPQHPHL